MDRQSSYPEPARGPERPLSREIFAAVHQQSQVRPRAARARRPKPALKKEEPEVAGATAWKPTRPVMPGCRRVRAAVSAPPPLPKREESSPAKRRVEMTPSALQRRSHTARLSQATKSPTSLRRLTPCRQRNSGRMKTLCGPCEQLIENSASHLRRALPLNRSKRDIADFLTKVEQQCQEAERHDSDEFV